MSEPVIVPPRVEYHVHHHDHRSRYGALVSSALFLSSALLFLWGADIVHVRFDSFADEMVSRLLEPTVLMLCVVHLALSVVMVLKGPANGLERALIRFMLAKVVFWGWLYTTTGDPRVPAQYLVVTVVVGITTVEVFLRMVNAYVWPLAEVFVPVRVVRWYDRSKRCVGWTVLRVRSGLSWPFRRAWRRLRR